MGTTRGKKIFDADKNLEGGLAFIDLLVAHMKRTSNEEWSRQQAAFINAVLRTANQDAALYRKVKGMKQPDEHAVGI